MKWYNKEKNRMLDLDSVNGFVFAKGDPTAIKGKDDTSDPTENRLEIIIGGSVFVFRGEYADEIYNLLTIKDKSVSNNEQLING
jgi:hypothetical protein